MHHPWRLNVTTSMVGLKNSHICTNLTKNDEPQRYSWESRRKRRRMYYWSVKSHLFILLQQLSIFGLQLFLQTLDLLPQLGDEDNVVRTVCVCHTRIRHIAARAAGHTTYCTTIVEHNVHSHALYSVFLTENRSTDLVVRVSALRMGHMGTESYFPGSVTTVTYKLVP